MKFLTKKKRNLKMSLDVEMCNLMLDNLTKAVEKLQAKETRALDCKEIIENLQALCFEVADYKVKLEELEHDKLE